ncbi:MAG: SDR family NAD(P)-dependent oxidoreductase [Nocardiaceae bacterium]|nr:SDR family NAD(P)-dependent oxidoreductase [Nocardiaceae bacterium]
MSASRRLVELGHKRVVDSARRESFTGRVAVITGGSSGIGLATAEALARRGVTVIIIARGVGDVKCAVQRIRDHNGTAYGYPCDVTDHYAVSGVAKAVIKEHGPVDFLINCAGRSIRRAVVSSTDRLHDYERTMAVNYFGAVDMILAFLPSMRERGRGHVVNISSIAVQTKQPLFSAYVASKSALDAFSVVAAAENADAGVSFTSIRMPLVRTPMIAPTSDFATLPVETPEQAAARVVRALAERPDRIDTPIGTLAEYLGYVAPTIHRAILHQVYRAFPESDVARLTVPRRPATTDSAPGNTLAKKVFTPLLALPTPGVRFTRWVPGLHW